MSGYKVSVGSATRRVRTFQEAGAFVVEHVTGLLAQDPEGAAEGVMRANREFSGGFVQQAVEADGIWRMSLTVHDEPVRVEVRKRWW